MSWYRNPIWLFLTHDNWYWVYYQWQGSYHQQFWHESNFLKTRNNTEEHRKSEQINSIALLTFIQLYFHHFVLSISFKHLILNGDLLHWLANIRLFKNAGNENLTTMTIVWSLHIFAGVSSVLGLKITLFFTLFILSTKLCSS